MAGKGESVTRERVGGTTDSLGRRLVSSPPLGLACMMMMMIRMMIVDDDYNNDEYDDDYGEGLTPLGDG